jgi:hypothetical protein
MPGVPGAPAIVRYQPTALSRSVGDDGSVWSLLSQCLANLNGVLTPVTQQPRQAARYVVVNQPTPHLGASSGFGSTDHGTDISVPEVRVLLDDLSLSPSGRHKPCHRGGRDPGASYPLLAGHNSSALFDLPNPAPSAHPVDPSLKGTAYLPQGHVDRHCDLARSLCGLRLSGRADVHDLIGGGNEESDDSERRVNV